MEMCWRTSSVWFVDGCAIASKECGSVFLEMEKYGLFVEPDTSQVKCKELNYLYLDVLMILLSTAVTIQQPA